MILERVALGALYSFAALGLAVAVLALVAATAAWLRRERTRVENEAYGLAMRATRASDHHHVHCGACSQRRHCPIGQRMDVEARRARLIADGQEPGEEAP